MGSEAKKCYVCGKVPLTKNEIGLTKKLINKKAASFYCIDCLAEYLEVTTEELEAKLRSSKKRDAHSSNDNMRWIN